jgi:O-acetyl-ADP-ribose deacetylase (regulator of RNase III)
MITPVSSNIVAMRVDAIVNAANEAFRGGGGVDGAIHRAAGPELLEECKRHARLPTGDAVLTRGHRLLAPWIIHTVGPIWRGTADDAELLERAYESVFRVAREHGEIRTIAFPAISTGAYGYPKDAAAAVAVDVMRRHESAFGELFVCVMDYENLNAYRNALNETPLR